MPDPDDKPQTTAQPTPARPTICSDDLAVDDSMALLFSDQAPLPVTEAIQKARGSRTKDDYKAVWAWTPGKPDPNLLVFFHGNHHYVTVDNSGASRIPDWAEKDKRADKGAASSVYYKLNELDARQASLPADSGTVKKPVVLVPEDVELLAPGANDWAAPPLQQYADTGRLWKLVEDCYKHLRCKPKPNGSKAPYLASTNDKSGPSYAENLKRVYLCGHSGGGKPMMESAASDLVLSGKVSIDLWLLDATYVWKSGDLDNYVALCQKWADGSKLGNGASNCRFVCIFKKKYEQLEWKKEDGKKVPVIDPATKKQKWHWGGTEEEADKLRTKLAKVLKKKESDLWLAHDGRNLETVIIPALKKNPVLFIRTSLEHEDIPTQFIPVLLRTAAS